MTIAELSASVLVQGDGSSPTWDATWRIHLVGSLKVLVAQLAGVGITEVYADGSFCSKKDHPGDIDGYFVTDFPEWLNQRRALLRIEAAWDLGRRRPDALGKMKPLMWHKYRVELFPVFREPYVGFSAMGGNPPVTIDQFFHESRSGQPRGVIKLVPAGDQP
jgi:hypothetical protein